MTLDMWHLTCETWQTTCDIWAGLNILSIALLVGDFWCLEDWEEKDDWLNERRNKWINKSITKVFVKQPCSFLCLNMFSLCNAYTWDKCVSNRPCCPGGGVGVGGVEGRRCCWWSFLMVAVTYLEWLVVGCFWSQCWSLCDGVVVVAMVFFGRGVRH